MVVTEHPLSILRSPFCFLVPAARFFASPVPPDPKSLRVSSLLVTRHPQRCPCKRLHAITVGSSTRAQTLEYLKDVDYSLLYFHFKNILGFSLMTSAKICLQHIVISSDLEALRVPLNEGYQVVTKSFFSFNTSERFSVCMPCCIPARRKYCL